MPIKLHSRPQGMYPNPEARSAFVSLQAAYCSIIATDSVERLKNTLLPIRNNENNRGYGIFSRVYRNINRASRWSKENRQAIYTSNKISSPTYLVQVGAFGKPICFHSPILYCRPVDRVFTSTVLTHQVQAAGLLAFAQRRKVNRKFQKEIPMSENNNLFDLYLSNNLQLGVGDLMEVKALRENKNVRSYRFAIDAGRFNNFNPHVSEETKKRYFSNVTSHRMGNSHEASVYEYYWLGDEIVAIVYSQVQYKNSTTTIICHEDVFEYLAEDLRKFYEDPAMRFVSKIKVSPDGAVQTTRERLLDRETERPFDEFYPFLPNGMGYKEFFDLYLKSRAPVLVLIGPPGTGKSTFLRALINYTNSDGFMIYDDDTKSRIEALDHFYANEGTVLAIEDADKHIGKRSNGNEAMAGFLNYTDGVIRNTSKKLVISTNLSSIGSIDEALLRPGRCFAVLQFRNLTATEARAARLAAGLPDDLDFSNRSEIPLAAALDDSNVVTQRTAQMGFYG